MLATGTGTKLQLLAAISMTLQRQQAALVTGNASAINTQFEALLKMMADLAALSSSAAGPQQTAVVAALSSSAAGPQQTAVVALARHLREQIAINQVLIRRGMAAADHYVTAIADAAAADDQALFSGVG